MTTSPAPARLLVLLLILTTLAAGSAHAGTRSERRCAATIGSVGRQLLNSTGTILAGCERAVARGRLLAGTDCVTEAKAVRRRSAVVGALGRRLVAACTDAEVVALEPTGACRGVATAVDLAACLA